MILESIPSSAWINKFRHDLSFYLTGNWSWNLYGGQLGKKNEQHLRGDKNKYGLTSLVHMLSDHPSVSGSTYVIVHWWDGISIVSRMQTTTKQVSFSFLSLVWVECGSYNNKSACGYGCLDVSFSQGNSVPEKKTSTPCYFSWLDFLKEHSQAWDLVTLKLPAGTAISERSACLPRASLFSLNFHRTKVSSMPPLLYWMRRWVYKDEMACSRSSVLIMD